MGPVTSLFVEGPSGRIKIDDGGSGAALPALLIHGLAGSSSQWSAQLRHLRRRRRAVALDLRGHGASEGSAPFSIEAFADDALAVADALDLRRFALLGFSLGGHVAGAVAGRVPERVAGVFLVDPASALTLLPAGDREADLAAAASDLGAFFAPMLQGARAAVRTRVLAEARATRPEVVLASLRALWTHDPVPPLRRYLASGGKARAVLSEQGRANPRRLHALLPEVTEEILPGTSHWLMMDEPDELQPRLDAFLLSL